MKTTILQFVFIFSLVQIHAQDYLISFVGTGMSDTVTTVKIENLTQGTSLILNGTDVLNLKKALGINQTAFYSENLLKIYPNPMNETGTIDFEATKSGMTTIEICDITGKQVVRSQTMLKCGRHVFDVNKLSAGNYTLSIKSNGYSYSGKLVSLWTGSGSGKITYMSSYINLPPLSKVVTTQSQVPMQYNYGDQLLFTGSHNIFSTVIPLIPNQSQTITFNFVACTDEDGNNYAIVPIGTQIWMARNLNVGIRINSSLGASDNGIIEKYCYSNNESNCNIYGGLYEWYELMQYVYDEGEMGICPADWHVPTNSEWTTLIDYLGGESVAGMKLKETGSVHWYNPVSEGSNSSGFTGLPGGWSQGYDTFSERRFIGYFWTSSKNGGTAFYRTITSSNKGSYQHSGAKDFGYSVRCIHD